LHGLAREEGPHPAHGIKLRYANPANGKHPFPTMAVFVQFLLAGFLVRPIAAPKEPRSMSLKEPELWKSPASV
jgi:gentisate 1,2-dioxygenase